MHCAQCFIRVWVKSALLWDSDVAAWRRAAFVLLMLLTSSLKCKRGTDLTQEGNCEGRGNYSRVSVLLMPRVLKNAQWSKAISWGVEVCFQYLIYFLWLWWWHCCQFYPAVGEERSINCSSKLGKGQSNAGAKLRPNKASFSLFLSLTIFSPFLLSWSSPARHDLVYSVNKIQHPRMPITQVGVCFRTN